MKLTDVDLNELLPIYAQGTPIANAIGEAVASALGGIFGRCESLPCEASQVACDAMRDDELDRVANDLQIVIYDPSASHEEKARFVYEFAGTRYTAGTYANLKKGLSIFADIPEGDVRIERESTWRYYIQLESPPAVSIERQRMMERLIPKAHRAVLGFNGMDIHYGNEGESRLFTPAGNACADTLLKGEASVRPMTKIPAKIVVTEFGGVSAPFAVDVLEQGTNRVTSLRRNVNFVVNLYPAYISESNMSKNIAFKSDAVPSSLMELIQRDCKGGIVPNTTTSNIGGNGVACKLPPIETYNPDGYDYSQSANIDSLEMILFTAIVPQPAFYFTKKYANDFLQNATYNLELRSITKNYTDDKASAIGRYCIALAWEIGKLAAIDEGLDGNLLLQEIANGDCNELLFNGWLKPTPQLGIGGSEAWKTAYAQNKPRAVIANWADVLDTNIYKASWDGMKEDILLKWQSRSLIEGTVLSQLSLNAWRSMFIPYPREWA